MEKLHPCELVYNAGANGKIYGTEKGFCRITGKDSQGVLFDKWIKDTFTDLASLMPGTIISNEAVFCFEEASELIQKKVSKDKPQRFRTYSHIVRNGIWYCYTKAHKKDIYKHLISGECELVCLSDSGQKHLVFKNRLGFWQLEEQLDIEPNTNLLSEIHGLATELLLCGFSQTEIITGDYKHINIMRIGVPVWDGIEAKLQRFRGSKIFDLATWMLFLEEEDKEEVSKLFKPIKPEKKKPEDPPQTVIQPTLF